MRATQLWLYAVVGLLLLHVPVETHVCASHATPPVLS
jgi:hypothetical protein